ncbi:MAG: nucleoside triphosphate pyrophosphohydrolase [Candidatus Caenarcaniphilales bacterium]|nr:nucleoside triphosphate pyrophosphohydrolase [Candidatus Caenarcaniphilales bacterium]
MSIEDFKNTVAALRNQEKGCPWVKTQTHSSLKRYLLEELYECLEAVDEVEEANPEKQKIANHTLKEELGDVLLQVMLHSEIAEERGAFKFSDVVDYINEKMIRRNPHVFSDASVKNTDEVDNNWEKIKKEEKKNRKSIFEGIPKELPSLARAWKISKKAVRESFEWDEERKLYEQLQSEIEEFKEVSFAKEELSKSEKDAAELELGDILFTVVNLARWFKIDPEEALRKTNNKFTNRFDIMMDIVKESGSSSLKEHSPTELQEFWQKAKHKQNEELKHVSK